MTSDTTTEPRGATRSVLRRRDYRLLLASFATSRAGDFLYVVAIVVYILDRTGSPAWVAAVTLGRMVPAIVMSPLAGVVADRFERRTTMMLSDVLQLVAMTGLTLVAALSGPVLLVLVLIVVSASAGMLYLAAASSMVAATVPEDELAAANSLFSTVDTIAFVAGPAVGGAVLLLGSAAAAFGINAATFGVSCLLLAGIRTRSRAEGRPEGGNALGELRTGARALLGNRRIAALIGCAVAAMAVYGVELVVLVLVSSELLGTGAEGLGWLLAASGLGGILGALVSSRLARAGRPRAVIAVVVLLTGLPLASLSVIRAPAIAYVVLLVEGAAIVALDILVETAKQRGVPNEVLGRVSGLAISLQALGVAAGTLVAPLLVDGLGLPVALLVAGLTPVVLAAASLGLLTGFDADVDAGRRVLGPRVDLLERLRLFEGASRPALEQMAAAVVEERVAAGTVVLRQGDPADDLFVLVDGSLVVDHEVDGTARRINTVSAPDYVGEIGLVERIPRTATVTAATDTLLWRIPGAGFLDAVAAGAALSPVLAGGIRTRLARTPARP